MSFLMRVSKLPLVTLPLHTVPTLKSFIALPLIGYTKKKLLIHPIIFPLFGEEDIPSPTNVKTSNKKKREHEAHFVAASAKPLMRELHHDAPSAKCITFGHTLMSLLHLHEEHLQMVPNDYYPNVPDALKGQLLVFVQNAPQSSSLHDTMNPLSPELSHNDTTLMVVMSISAQPIEQPTHKAQRHYYKPILPSYACQACLNQESVDGSLLQPHLDPKFHDRNHYIESKKNLFGIKQAAHN
jgi:hypothetical protein